MSHHKKCVVIKIGSHHTIAGFNNTELPQCILPSSYLKKGSDEYIFGTISMLEEAIAKKDKDTNENLEVFTTVDENGIPYNWSVIEQQLKYIYDTQLKCDPQDLPLVITVPHLKSELANKVLERYFDLAFTKLNVPVLQIIIEPLAIALAMGKTSALVIDLGSSGCNVTPIVDGTVVKTSVMRSRFAGDFLDYRITQRVEDIVKKKKNSSSSSEVIDAEGDINISTEDNNSSNYKDSVDVWLEANTWIHDFKMNMLQVSDKELPELERFYKEQAEMQIRQQEQLQQYSTNNAEAKLDSAAIASIQNNNPLLQKKNFLYKLSNQTISLESRQCYELAESLFNPSMISDKYTKEDGLGEIIGKAIKKAGASVSSVGTNTIGALGASMTIQPMNTQSKNNIFGNNNDNSNNNNNNNVGINSLGTTATTPEYIYSMLLTNIIVTGSTSLINGMEQRIIKELSTRFPQYKITTFASQITMDRKIQGWTSSVSMSNLPSWELAKWYTKADYEKELNGEAANEK
ncbi:similar to Saccharomyces cerevisiae YPR034W ARP7 Component of both the SWI/SNF and RSC chromatin remodeling complexes [Maudiozyma barnettii]|uniref:Similar to Saccharomyces cerevisiae YPR034W ARP7 Component of both the SWI/SNF and RSC chromatin remodeling complexes n=1 Tax=Maudiozyma barnettii TaxID=61262 RepID=A0A8H2VBB3_9SACH|nr:Arp7p [Kazachstania barnettii]CAB4252137.1 similar to Saccharomyces cerevisiae YPR034W ARP7 Component of both the SWI/SNF and RSC chromatin remodeling complexes [Kazachstania barnettii]CAD1778691.1 similar to Saccharomyces cerevisiae YPR034W ARP7 Component of both the SWI/SNF and RSC chromatin remodeling complexes [Kazachstania barnettii]